MAALSVGVMTQALRSGEALDQGTAGPNRRAIPACGDVSYLPIRAR